MEMAWCGELKRSHLETNILWDITCLTPNVLHTCERCRSTSGNFYLGETQAILAQLDEVMMASCWVKFMDLKKSGLVCLTKENAMGTAKWSKVNEALDFLIWEKF